LLEIDLQEFFTEIASGEFQFVAYANDGLIQTKTGLETNRH